MKLEIKHLAPYLPYGLKAKFQAKNKKTCRKYVIGTISVMYSDCSICCYDTVNATPDNFKPILRPLSDLTKEIEINGEKFVPIVELAKIAYPDLVWEFDRTRAISEWKKKPAYFFFQKNSFFACLFNNAIPNQIVLFNKLFEWHFDVFGLIDQGLALPLI